MPPVGRSQDSGQCECQSAFSARCPEQRFLLEPLVPNDVKVRALWVRVSVNSFVTKDQERLTAVVPSGPGRIECGFAETCRQHKTHPIRPRRFEPLRDRMNHKLRPKNRAVTKMGY
jgi:hypothetical protein